jgi:ATP-dependent RNA helicase DeaD
MNIHERLSMIYSIDPIDLLMSIIKQIKPTVKSVVGKGYNADTLNGDLTQSERDEVMGRFRNRQLQLLVATDVAARGIHVDNVDVVIHYNPPEDHKTYLHRSGRTARAGNSGTAVTMFLWDEELQVRQLQRRLGIKLPFHDVFSNDDRLDELASWAQNQN